MSDYKPVIGLEIHVELKTKSKMFCQCNADYFGKKPNTHVCPVCLGLPGALPVPNKKAIDWTILIGKALNCTINATSKFDRKHYFYPDLPKGYQISQYDEPIAINGQIVIASLPAGRQGVLTTKQSNPNEIAALTPFARNDTKVIRIRRVHQEEDTGKLIHSGEDTLIDFNRSGVPLVEIVTEPDFDNSDDVKRFLEELQVIIRYLGVSDADMEKGTMRLEPNISVREISPPNRRVRNQKLEISKDNLPKYKVEVKNINSFRFVKQAIEYEVKRQTAILEDGKIPTQETRGYNESKGITYSQRTKEEAHDYRYFPEPDIPPLKFTDKELTAIFNTLPELPAQRTERFVKEFGVKYQDAFIITRDKVLADYFEKLNGEVKKQTKLIPQQIANLIINKKIPAHLSVNEFIKKALELTAPKETDINLLESSVEKIINANSKVVEDYKKGRKNSIMFLVGQVMKEMKGKADAKLVIERLKKKLALRIGGLEIRN